MTKPDSRLRRQVYLLSAQDFADHPVWEFCGDEEGFEEQDEATVKPSGEAEISGYAPGAYVVAADATLPMEHELPAIFIQASPTILAAFSRTHSLFQAR